MSIVTLNVSTQTAPAPNTLQRTGALVSHGGTSLAPGAKSLLYGKTDLTAILAGAVTVTSATWASNVLTVNTATPHGFTTGDTGTTSGFTPSAFNITATMTVTGASSFTMPLASNPGTTSVVGVVTDADVSEITAMVNTYFAQGSAAPVYVLEMGHGTNTAGVTALSTYITANPGAFYEYLIPRGWDAEAGMVTLASAYTSATAEVYFGITATLSTYASFATLKSARLMIEAPGIPATEFTAAARLYNVLKENPSPTNQVAPFAYRFLFGVTSYPATATQKATFKAANLDYVTDGSEGGISNKILALGVNADGNPINYWYSVDAMQINLDTDLAAEIINGSNNPQAPLYYNQAGINRLRIKAAQRAANQVGSGLAVGPVTQYQLTAADFTALLNSGTAPVGVLVNSVPFSSYVALNPNDYPIGLYTGLSISYTPARGFTNITVNLNVSNFIPTA
ncbi:MAG: hypothetical protein JO002_01015 [Burkholderiaceae bacterium]|nr:hypothetical protein [Burkholderiaceae bacterium]